MLRLRLPVAGMLSILLCSSFGEVARAADLYIGITPCRLVDTRTTPQGGILTSGPVRAVTVTGTISGSSCNIPANAKAVSVNLTAIGPSAQGFLTLYPSDAGFPGVATLNVDAGQNALGNGALVALAFDGTSAVEPSLNVVYGTAAGGTTHSTIDVTGYFVDAALSFYPTFGGNGGIGTPDFSSGGTLFSTQYQSVTIPAGQTVTTFGAGGGVVTVKGTCTIAGNLVVARRLDTAFGQNGEDGTGAPTLGGITFGPDVYPTNTYANVRFCRGGRGGSGAAALGTMVHSAGGAARSAFAGTTRETIAASGAWKDVLLPLWISCGGGSGGAGAPNSCAGSAGNGGGGGGVLYLECGALDFPAGGTIHSDGGDGGAGTGNCGGGGGGGGGFVIIRTRRIISNAGLITVNAGAAGSGGSATFAAEGGAVGEYEVILVP